MEQTPDRTTLTAFAGAVLIGGSNFIAVRFSNEELEPLFGAALRFTVAAFIFIVLMRVQGLSVPKGPEALGATIYGLLGFGVSYAFLYYALVGLSAGTASVMVAATPLVTLILAVLHRQERFTTRGLVGGSLAVVGIAVLSLDSLGGDLQTRYLFASFAGVIAVGESSVVIKGFPRAHPITTNAIGMTAGAILLVIASLVFDESWVLPERGRTWIALGWLILAGSVGLFVLFLYVIQRWTASATVYALTLMPVVAVTLGALLADEEVSIELVAGGALVMTAVYVGALSGKRRPSPQAQEAPPEPEVTTAEKH